MSIRQGSDWSGFVTVSTLPGETLQRMGMNASLVEHSRRTPTGSVFESFSSRQYGVPMIAETLPGGAASVSVNTFNRFQPGPRAYPATDAWDTKRIVESQWHQFFGDYVNGRMRVAESAPPYSKPIGPVSYGGRNRQKSRPVGVPDWYRPLPGEPGASQPGTSREEARIHDGPCAQVHPTSSHADWTQAGEEEERQRVRSKATELYLRTLIRESSHKPSCPLRNWALKKLSQS